MRTRTLLLLAVGCGLAILIAGVIQLLRIAGQDDAPPAARIGEPVQLGDVVVNVEGFGEADGRATVELEVGGVDDPDGTDDFRLIVPGASLRAVDDGCDGTTVASRACSLAFDVSDADGSSRVLLYRRGDEQVRWVLREP